VFSCPARCNINIPFRGFFPGYDASISMEVAWVPGQLSVQGTDVYFIVDAMGDLGRPEPLLSGIRRVSAGGVPEPVVSSPLPVALALTSTLVVFTDDGPGTTPGVFTVPLDGGTASRIATTVPPTAPHIVTDGKEAFFSDVEGAKAVSLSGGTVRMLTGAGGDVGIAGANLVVTDYDGGTVVEVPLDGSGSAATVASGQAYPGSPISCGAGVCWVDNVSGTCDIPSAFNAQVMRLGPDGGVPSIVASQCYTRNPVGSVVSDGTDVFLVASNMVLATPVAGGDTRMIASLPVYWAAVDSCCLYTSGVLGIQGVPKPDESATDAASGD